MKYEFIKVDPDTTTLKYKEKEFTFIKNIMIATKLQGINFTARNEMIMDLAKQGMTTDNLIIRRIENGKKYEDETNIKAMESNYIQKASLEIFNEICIKYTNMDLSDLLVDIGLTEEEEAKEFVIKIKEAILGTNSPSEKK